MTRPVVVIALTVVGCGCACPPAPSPRGLPRDPAAHAWSQPVEAFTCARQPTARVPSGAALLAATGHALSPRRGEWPSVALAADLRVPDPMHPVRRVLGLEFEPAYVAVREANALVLRHRDRPPTVIPLDPDRPLLWPEDLERLGGPCAPRAEPQRARAARLWRQRLARDLEGVPPDGVEP